MAAGPNASRYASGRFVLLAAENVSFAMFALEAQMKLSASRHIPSGPTPSAHTRRLDKAPSSSMSKAVSGAAKDSATTSVFL
jgi:hypothetical protein